MTITLSRRRKPSLPTRLIAFAIATVLAVNQAVATTYYWDTNGTTAGLGSATTPANWNGSSFWNTDATGGSGGTMTTWSSTNNAILAGTAGTITINTSTISAGTVTANTDGYVLTSSAATRGLVASSLVLANNVGLELNTNSGNGGSGTSAVWALGGITLGSGSTLTVSGAASAANGNTIYLTSATTITGGGITLAGSGAGVTGFVSSVAAVNINTVITNNSSTSATQLGASSTGSLTMGAKVTGSAGLMFGGKSGTASGGAGTITLNAVNDYSGATAFNAATGGLIKLGIDNALPSGTDVTMAASASNGGILDLNGHNQTIGSLTSGAGGGSITNGASGSGTNTLTISGSASPAAFGLAITDGATAKTALTRSGIGTTILSGTSTYTGATQITGGTLTVSGSLGNTAVTLSNSNSTLSSGVNATSSIAGTVTANSGTFIAPGGAGTVGTFTLGGLTVNTGAALNFDLLGSSNYDQIITSGTLNLGAGTETINLAGSGFTSGTYTLLSGYSGLSSGAFTLGTTPAGFNYSLSTGTTSTVLTVSALGGGGSLAWSLGGLAPTSATDGAGNWTNGAGNFYNTGTSAATTWDNTATNTLSIGNGGAGGTITLGGSVRVGGALTFAAASSPYAIGTVNGTNTLTVAAGITANNSATINAPTILEASQSWNVASGMTLTENGAVSETGGSKALTKTGAGKLVLTSTSNSYSGGTVFGAGIVSVSSDANLGDTAGGLTFSGGTLQTTSGITSSRAVTLNSGGGIVDTNGVDSTLNGNITGAGALTKNGQGALTLTGTNTYGGTTVNAGTLNTNGSYTGATTLAGGTLSNGGSITLGGASIAVSVTGNNATLTNLGTIDQTGTGRAIRDNTGVTGLVINNGSSTNSTALMRTADADVIQMNKPAGSVTLNNYGTMTSLNASAGGSQAVDFAAISTGSNTINNFSTGTMQAAEADAVRPGVNGFVNNDGLIKSTRTSSSGSDGIDAQTNTGITIVNAASAGSGMIDGARHGITGGNVATDSNGNPTVNNGAFTMSITNNAGGTIKGNGGSGVNIDGLNANELVTIVNHGTITGNGQSLGDGVAHDGDGIDVDGLVNITNTGIIKSINAYGGAPVNGVQTIEFSEGVTVGGGTITNSGTIQGSVAAGNNTAIGRGVTIAGVDKLLTTDGQGVVTETSIPAQAPYAATTITNQTGGQIIGDTDSAIIFSSPNASGFSHAITNEAGALIQTGSTTAAAILLAVDNTTINNSGIIDGSSSGKAITGGAGNITLNILGNAASILGDITGGTGTNSLVIDPGAGNTFAYAGSISNFATMDLKSGTTTLSAANGFSGTTLLDGGNVQFSGNGVISSQINASVNGTFNTGGGTLTLTAGLVKNGSVLTIAGGGTVNVNNVGISGANAGSDLVVDGTTLNINTASSYNGPTYIRNGGTINANVAEAIPATNGRSAMILDDSGTGSSKLALGADQTVASLSGTSTSSINLNGNKLTIGATGGSTTFAGSISGSGGSLTKDGASELVLTGTNSYTGDTSVDSGKVTLASPGMITSNVIVKNTGVFSVSGSIGGTGTNVTVETGGTFSVTDTSSTGLASFTGTGQGLIMQSASTMLFDIGGTTRGSGYDYVTGLSSLTLPTSGAAAHFSLAYLGSYTPTAGDTFDLLDFTTLTSGVPSLFDFTPAPTGFTWNTSAFLSSGTITLAATPEPGRAALLLIGGVAVAMRRRRLIKALPVAR